MSPAPSDPYGFRQELKDLLRAVAGGSIVGMPLLYTMEMWFHGATLSPWHQLVLLGCILVVNFAFCLVSGFRHDSGVGEAVMEAVTSVGIALVYSTAILWLIGTIAPQTSLAESVGKVLLEASAGEPGRVVRRGALPRQVAHRRGERRDARQQATSRQPIAGPSSSGCSFAPTCSTSARRSSAARCSR